MQTYLGELHSSSLWGPTCDSLDVILKDTPLPELNLGDTLFFEDMGAYTKASASTFNGYPKPEAHYYVTEDYKAAVESVLKPIIPRAISDFEQTITA